MDVLNTYGGGVTYDVFTIVVGSVIFLLFGMLAVMGWSTKEYGMGVIFTLLALVGLLGVVFSAVYPEPVAVRHEVTLRPGSVIDAQKYDIVEQRGAIFVIEERTQNAD
ncbi:hypothetical protein C162_25985 [Paenibacillus sp. FSL R7-269]|uniref:hypothetical protein n=1 Tax=Paenibacillus sp. FSL R7-269 TaxID=1226755 RepID=UPI0003E1F705|nr:hypothetical protein [Paenibacillus sp. FSL R7-269]ETT41588.1 hypothetical protein C162_25985 [Paenibacillus sp. FSL R7-269]